MTNMTTIKTLTLATAALIACDSGEHTIDMGAAHGLGDAPLRLQIELAAQPLASTPTTATPSAGTTLDAHDDGAQTTSAGGGAPARGKDVRGWLRWSGALPYYAGPIFDETGAQCADGQSGNVWYLPGTAGGPVNRSCTIPVGKQIVFPLLNYYSAVPESYYTTEEEQQAYLADFAETSAFLVEVTCSLTATLDGVDLYGGDLDSTWRTEFERFDVELPDDPDNFADWFGLVGGSTPAVMSGYFARLAPLTPGDHTLEFGGTLCSDGEVWFETHASYQIHVQ